MTDDAIDAHKLAEMRSRTPEFMQAQASKPFGWDPAHFVEWATVAAMLETVGLPHDSSVIDVGCGIGWTTLFLAETGYDVVGYDLVPANVELARARAARWGSSARFEVGDMERLPDGPAVDAALIFDALHHSTRQATVLRSVSRRVRPGGWLFLGEPSWLHRFSPTARATQRDLGWVERGLSLRALKRDLRSSGFSGIRRFFQPTHPYEGRGSPFIWQAVRLVAGNVLAAPQMHLWLAAQRDL